MEIDKLKVAATEVKLVGKETLIPLKGATSTVLNTSKDVSKQVIISNTTYIVRTTFDLKGRSITVPKGCTLSIERGGFKNGTIVGQNTIVVGSGKIFNKVNIEGTWDCPGNVGWFADGCEVIPYGENGARPNNNGVKYLSDDSENIQYALDSSFRELIFPPKLFYIANPIILRKEKKITLQGSKMALPLDMCRKTMNNTCVIFTDKNIDMFIIAVKENLLTRNSVSIQGGTFDCSLCPSYTSSCILVKTDEQETVWGLDIDTNILGRPGNTSGFGINIGRDPDASISDVMANNIQYNLSNFGYATQVRIKGTIYSMGTGISVKNYTWGNTTTYFNWCTDVQIDCTIIECLEAIYSNTDTDIRGMIQSANIHAAGNSDALINLDSTVASIGANIFDMRMGPNRASYAVNIKNPNAIIVAYGLFAGIHRAGLYQLPENLKFNCATGYSERLTY